MVKKQQKSEDSENTEILKLLGDDQSAESEVSSEEDVLLDECKVNKKRKFNVLTEFESKTDQFTDEDDVDISDGSELDSDDDDDISEDESENESGDDSFINDEEIEEENHEHVKFNNERLQKVIKKRLNRIKSEKDIEESNEESEGLNESNIDNDKNIKEEMDNKINETNSPIKDEVEFKKPITIAKVNKNDSDKFMTAKEKKNLIFKDSGLVESVQIKEEIIKRMEQRLKSTVVIIKIGKKGNNAKLKKHYPNLVSAIIPYNTMYHTNYGKAYIDFETPEDAHKALKKDTKYKAFSIPIKEINIDNYNCNRLAISNLNYKTTINDLKPIFPNAQHISFLPTRNVDKKMTRVAFAEYKSVEEAISDYDSKHGYILNDNPLNIKFQEKSRDTEHKKFDLNKKLLVVSGIKKKTTRGDLKTLLPNAIKLKLDASKGVAYIQYNSIEECKIDRNNAIKNKPYGTMKILFDCKLDEIDKNKKYNLKVNKKNKNNSKAVTEKPSEEESENQIKSKIEKSNKRQKNEINEEPPRKKLKETIQKRDENKPSKQQKKRMKRKEKRARLLKEGTLNSEIGRPIKSEKCEIKSEKHIIKSESKEI